MFKQQLAETFCNFMTLYDRPIVKPVVKLLKLHIIHKLLI